MPFPKGRKFTEEHKAKISAAQKGKNSKRAKRWVVTFPNGTKKRIKNLRHFCREHGLKQSNMWKVANGIASHHKGFGCKRDRGNKKHE